MVNGWQPIDTAPKDGTRILAYGVLAFDGENEKSIGTVEWRSRGWVCSPNEATEYDPEQCTITHWQHLPAPPV